MLELELSRVLRILGAVHKLCRLGRGGEGGSPKDDLLHRPYLMKTTTRGKGVKNH